MAIEITFSAFYKGKRRCFEIDRIGGTGGMWFLFIDKFYYGSFSIYRCDWVFRPQHDHYFTPDQIDKLEHQLRKYHPMSK